MKSIIPYLWFNENAEEAVEFYTGIFPDSRIGKKDYFTKASSEVSGMPEGMLMSCQFWLCGQEFGSINGGDFFKHTPAVSFTVPCETEEEIKEFWEAFKAGGKELMPLQEYPFSGLYGWIEDRFGVSWQLNLTKESPKIVPSLLFVGEHFGKASEAAREYARIFKDDGKVMKVEPYSEKGPDPEGEMKYCLVRLGGQEFILMDGPGSHEFGFTGAISFLIDCEDQSEIDHFWKEITEQGKELPCGWAADKYGVHWQIFATFLEDYFRQPDKEKSERALQAMYRMKKIIIGDITNA